MYMCMFHAYYTCTCVCLELAYIYSKYLSTHVYTCRNSTYQTRARKAFRKCLVFHGMTPSPLARYSFV